MKISPWILAFIALIFLIISIIAIKQCNVYKHAEVNNVSALTDTTKVVKNKDGSTDAKKQALEGDASIIKSLNYSHDSLLNRLIDVSTKAMKTESKYQASIVFANKLEDSIVTLTHSIPRDTVRNGNLVYIYPEYSMKDSNKYRNVSAIANKDKFTVKASFTDTGSYTIGQEKGKTYVNVHHDNPYITNQDYRAFNVTNTIKDKKLLVGLEAGYGPALFEGQIKMAMHGGIALVYKIFGIK